MKKVLFAMLVSGMLFSCTNNKSEETNSADSTAVIESTVAPLEAATEVVEEVEVDTTAEAVEADTTAAPVLE